jgi:hypothetical protein
VSNGSDLRDCLAAIRTELDKFEMRKAMYGKDRTYLPAVVHMGCAVADACHRMAATVNREVGHLKDSA